MRISGVMRRRKKRRKRKAPVVMKVSPLGERHAAQIRKSIHFVTAIQNGTRQNGRRELGVAPDYAALGDIHVGGGAPNNVDAVSLWRQSAKNAGPRAGGYHEIALVPSEICLEAPLEAVRRARDCWTA